MIHPRIVLTSLVVVALACSGCGGKKRAEAAKASTATVAPAAAVSDTTPAAATAQPAVDVVIGGAATALAPGALTAEPLPATGAVRGNCALPADTFATCQAATGAGGVFLVTEESTLAAPTDYSVVVRCGTSPSQPIAAAAGLTTPLAADLNFDPYGEVIGVQLNTSNGSDAALIYQPTGASCPRIFGVGPVAPMSIMGGGTNVVTMKRPDGSLICVTADAAAGFVVSEPGGDACA